MSITISFRPGIGEDVRYIKSSWLHSFRNGEGVKDIPNSVYFDYEEKILRYIIPRCSNVGGILIAYESDGTDEWRDVVDRPILGYIVCEPFEGALMVHMTYVRGYNQAGKKMGKQYRRLGIGTALLEAAQRKFGLETAPLIYTYRTKMCWSEYDFRQRLKDLGATYVFYPKYTLLPSDWETGQAPVG